MFRNFVIAVFFVALPSVVVAQFNRPGPSPHNPLMPIPTFDHPLLLQAEIPVEAPCPTPAEFDPNDPQLSELWKKIEGVQSTRRAVEMEWHQTIVELHQQEKTFRTEIMNKLGEKRLEELRSRRVTEKIDVTKIGLGALDFPEINGSASCSNLARLVTCRILGVPYQWTAETKEMHGQQIMTLQVVVDEEKAPARAVTIMKGLLREFGGTHQAYRSLIEGLAQQEPTVTIPVYSPSLAPMVPPVLPPYPDGVTPLAPVPIFPVPATTVSVPETPKPVPADLIIVARRPSDDEIALAKQHNVELDVCPIALDALVLLVNRKNPVQNLSIEQVLDFYDAHRPAVLPPEFSVNPPARMFMWQEFGGLPNRQVTAYERERNSGSRELMDAFIAEHRKPLPLGQIAARTHPGYTGRLTNIQSMIGPMFSLNADENGIAYSVFNYEHFMAINPNVKVLNIEGIEPTSETIRLQTYPAIAEIFVVTKKGIAEDSPMARLRDFLLGEDGQRLVHEAGYVPISNNATKTQQRVGDVAQRSPRMEAEEDVQLIVRITKDDKIIIGDATIDVTSKDKIVSLIERSRESDRMLFIADPQTKHESVKLLLEAAGDAGVKRIEFEVRAE